MRIVIILIAWRKARNVLALGSPDLCPQLRLRPASMTANFDDAVKPRKTPLPHFNVACNSPATLSNFESTSLKFRGFLNIANLSDHRIACEIDGERPYHSLCIGPSTSPCTSQIPKPTPPFQSPLHPRRSQKRAMLSHQRLMNSREPTSKLMKFVICKRSQPRRQRDCDGLRTHAMAVCGRPLCFAIAWFLVRSKLLADRLIERFGRDKL